MLCLWYATLPKLVQLLLLYELLPQSLLRPANYGLQLLLAATSELAHHCVVHGRRKLLISSDFRPVTSSRMDLEL